MIRDARHQLVMFDEMIKAGIMPWDAGVRDMNGVLANLPPDEARRLKRKYRKVWRSQMKRHLVVLEKQLKNEKNPQRLKHLNDQIAAIKARFGAGNPKPSRAQRVKRRQEVGAVFTLAANQRITAEEAQTQPKKTRKRAPKR